jgi:hypothetical protein
MTDQDCFTVKQVDDARLTGQTDGGQVPKQGQRVKKDESPALMLEPARLYYIWLGGEWLYQPASGTARAERLGAPTTVG